MYCGCLLSIQDQACVVCFDNARSGPSGTIITRATTSGTSMVQLSADPVSDNVNGVSATGPLAAAGFSAGVKLQESAADHQSLLTGLSRSPKHLPCSYLYDGPGSKLYDDITELEEYYLFRTEQALLHTHAGDIVSHIQPGSVVAELGCGSAAKTSILLNALLARDGPDRTRFAGIDVSGSFLAAAKESLLASCAGLRAANVDLVCAEYIEGVRECRRRFPTERLVLLWLGSSVGNSSQEEAVQFFRDVMAAAGQNSQVFLCADLWKEEKTLRAAYHDSLGVTEEFIKNGIQHALRSLGHGPAGDASLWEYDVVVNGDKKQVEMWLVSKADTGEVAPGISIAAGERVLVEISRKFTVEQLQGLAYNAGLYMQASWRTKMYSMQMLVPALDAFELCWRDTDALFATMPDWSVQPISMRHPFGFYYGHLPAFAKLKMFSHLPTEPLDDMLSRGIDPDVTDPSKCHSHPEVPTRWPSRPELQEYCDSVRSLLRTALAGGPCDNMRLVCLALEHERMHQETLSYMVTQQVKAEFESRPEAPLTPPPSPDAAPLLESVECMSLVAIPGGDVKLGVPLDGSVGFVWDNEGPPSAPQHVADFLAATEPVSVADFYVFAVAERGYSNSAWWQEEDWQHVSKTGQDMPATWSRTASGRVAVHSPSGSVPWKDVCDAPVRCSLAEAQAFCAWRGGGARVLSEAEYQRIVDVRLDNKVANLREGGWEWTSTPFAPFKGFEPMPEYTEYSTDFFDGKHYVLRGSSEATHPAMSRDSFRNFYQRLYPFPAAHFRCCFDSK